MEAPVKRCRWRFWERLVRATKASLSSRFVTGTYWTWALLLTLFISRQKEDGISRWRETRKKGFIFTSGQGLFRRKLMVRISFEQNVCWKSRHCFWMNKYSYSFSCDGTQSSDSIFYWKRFRPQAFWITSKLSVSCFSHSISSSDGSGFFALFALYFNSTYSYDVANVANENIFRM